MPGNLQKFKNSSASLMSNDFRLHVSSLVSNLNQSMSKKKKNQEKIQLYDKKT